MNSREGHELLNAAKAGLQVSMQSITSALVATGDLTPRRMTSKTELEQFADPIFASDWLSAEIARVPTKPAYEWNLADKGAPVHFTCTECEGRFRFLGRRLKTIGGARHWVCSDCAEKP